MRVTWTSGAWVGLVGLAALAACTIANPAYEDDGGGTVGPGTTGGSLGTSSTLPPTDDPPLETGPGEGSLGTTLGETGTTSEPGTTGDTGDAEPLPPEVGPYGAPMLVPGINDPFAEDDDPTLTEDMLELYFASRRFGGRGNDDIWVATRESDEAPWEPPVAVEALNTLARENTPEISLDGLTMWFASDRYGLGEEVYVSTRRGRGQPWSEPMRVPGLSSAGRDVCPFVTDDGLHAYVCTGELLTLDLVLFSRDGRDGPWLGPVPITELDTPGLDCGAWVDQSERVIAFMSDRPGGAGSTDLYVASRESTADPFGMPERLAELASPGWDDDPWLSQDGDVMYFASDRTGGGDIYVVYRAK